MTGPATSGRAASRASLALGNLRAVVILLVLSFHSVLAYLSFLPPAPFAFDSPPYLWRAFPIVDSRRWFGFDLYCAWQDVFLMSLFFFLSGLFVWPSLTRKDTGWYLHDRLRRLGLPFVLSVALLMPAALYPTYLQTAADRGVLAYVRHWLALPFWPCGPMWFLWLLLVADIAAAGFYAWLPRSRILPTNLAAAAERSPVQFFLGVAIASVLAYSALALAFGSSDWGQWGPFAFQLCRPAHYAVYFFAGVAAGARGIGGRLFAAEGPLAGRWRAWLGAALASFLLWLTLTAALLRGDGAPVGLAVADYVSFALACFASCFFVLAAILRFGAVRSPLLKGLGVNAYAMYLVHYLFVVWLQYALLGAALPAIIKGALVFAGTLVASWGSTAGCRALAPMLHYIAASRWRRAAAS
ncbi:MAG TPA: acyltransferase [Stellaceae bacterium]